MNFDRSLIFAYLEEDNIQRAYFRVRPLLTLDGDIRDEAMKLWPNEGGLRIVPDRNEQHTFKVRMRTLGSYCVVDLRNQPIEAGKIRTNKNFRPDKGEINQYILYSDTVHALPENTFYQLLDGKADDYAALAAQAVTPMFYVRQEDTLYGPVSKASPAMPETAKEAAGMLYEIPCPDHVTRLLLCMDDAAEAVIEETAAVEKDAAVQSESSAPTAVETVQEDAAPASTMPDDTPEETAENPAALPIGEKLHILDQSQGHEDTLKQLDKPVSDGANLLKESAKTNDFTVAPGHSADLSGTPLIKTPLRMSVQQPKNRTQEIVSNQWSVGKYEPPAQNLPSGASLRAVENPVETACATLRSAWNTDHAREQLTNYVLSLDGAKARFEEKLCNGGTLTVTQRVLRERLQDLEAERLTALCELDRARRDTDAYKQELLTGLSARISRDTQQIEQDKSAAQSQLDTLKTEINALTAQRNALLDKVAELQRDTLPETVAKLLADAHMVAPAAGIPLRMTPVSGADADAETLICRMMDACAASGIEIDRNCAIALLTLLAVSPRIGIACSTPAAASTLLHNLAFAFGWKNSYVHQYAQDHKPLLGMRTVDATPALLTTSLPNYAPVSGVTKLTLNRSAGNLVRNAAYDVSQWPILMLPALPFVPDLSDQEGNPVRAASIAAFGEAQTATQNEMEAVLSPILKAASPLSGPSRKEMFQFISACADKMEGGFPVAVDWAILLWIVPALERGTKAYAAVKSLLNEFPLSQDKM